MGADHYRLIIVGAGSAGLAAADFAARLGVSVALVERDRVGGDCTWNGCIPSKALLHLAQLYHSQPAAHGVVKTAGAVSFPAVMAYVREAIQRVYRLETPEALGARGIRVLRGEAHFLDPYTLDVAGHRVRGQAFLLATGARPSIPSIPGLSDGPYLTYETVFDLANQPARLAVLGAGPVGVELAQAFQRLGSQVTLLDHHKRVASLADPEAGALLGRVFGREGMLLRLGTRIDRVRYADGEVLLDTSGQTVTADALLVATGRRPTLKPLDLDRAGVRSSEEGIVVDATLKTSQPHIYACGDAIGSFQFTHYAGWQAVMAARNLLLPGNARGQLQTVPWTLFTTPAVAQVGLDERQARERYGKRLAVTRWPSTRIDRAVTDGQDEGFIKLMHLRNGKLVGGTVVSENAGELANELSLALSQRLSLSDLAMAIHVYPTYGFALQQAAADGSYERLVSGLRGTAIRLLACHWPVALNRRSRRP